MYKKIVSAVAAAVMLIPSAGAADNMKFYVTDVNSDKVKISVELSESNKGNNVALYVLNPGKTEEDIFTDANTALQYSGQKIYGENALDFDFTVNTSGIGAENKYKYFILTDFGKRLDGSFDYYTITQKTDYVENTVNHMTAEDTEVIDNIYKMFNLQSFALYENITDKKYMAKLLSEKSDITVETIEREFKEAAIITAFSKGNAGLTDAEGELIYPEYIVFDEYFENLKNSVTAEGKNAAVEAVCASADFGSLTEIKEALQKEYIAAAIYYNTSNGYGHIAGILNNCTQQLAADGLNEINFSNASKEAVAKSLWSGQKLKYSEMIAAINALCMPGTSGGISGGGTSGGGGGSSGGKNSGASSVVVSAPEANTGAAAVENVTFSDLKSVEWARKSIEKLYEKKIISGKEKGIFAPNDYVTRAEFAVMISKAFEFERNKKTSEFEDIKASDWFYEDVLAGESAGIIKGSGKEFMPQRQITREEIAALLVRTLIYKNRYEEIAAGTSGYNDSNLISEYAKESIEVMTALGIVSGDTSGCFRPKDNSTRAEAAVMIAKTIEFVEKK